jgi:hypothetical protein
MSPKTPEEIKVEKILDAWDLQRLETNRRIYDMEGYEEPVSGTFERADADTDEGVESEE